MSEINNGDNNEIDNQSNIYSKSLLSDKVSEKNDLDNNENIFDLNDTDLIEKNGISNYLNKDIKQYIENENENNPFIISSFSENHDKNKNEDNYENKI